MSLPFLLYSSHSWSQLLPGSASVVCQSILTGKWIEFIDSQTVSEQNGVQHGAKWCYDISRHEIFSIAGQMPLRIKFSNLTERDKCMNNESQAAFRSTKTCNREERKSIHFQRSFPQPSWYPPLVTICHTVWRGTRVTERQDKLENSSKGMKKCKRTCTVFSFSFERSSYFGSISPSIHLRKENWKTVQCNSRHKRTKEKKQKFTNLFLWRFNNIFCSSSSFR